VHVYYDIGTQVANNLQNFISTHQITVDRALYYSTHCKI